MSTESKFTSPFYTYAPDLHMRIIVCHWCVLPGLPSPTEQGWEWARAVHGCCLTASPRNQVPSCTDVNSDTRLLNYLEIREHGIVGRDYIYLGLALFLNFLVCTINVRAHSGDCAAPDALSWAQRGDRRADWDRVWALSTLSSVKNSKSDAGSAQLLVVPAQSGWLSRFLPLHI